MKVGRMFINGKWKLAAEGATREILNPANNKVIGIVAEGTQKDAELAIQAARKAFDEGPWPQMRATERAIAAVQAGRSHRGGGGGICKTRHAQQRQAAARGAL